MTPWQKARGLEASDDTRATRCRCLPSFRFHSPTPTCVCVRAHTRVCVCVCVCVRARAYVGGTPFYIIIYSERHHSLTSALPNCACHSASLTVRRCGGGGGGGGGQVAQTKSVSKDEHGH